MDSPEARTTVRSELLHGVEALATRIVPFLGPRFLMQKFTPVDVEAACELAATPQSSARTSPASMANLPPRKAWKENDRAVIGASPLV